MRAAGTVHPAILIATWVLLSTITTALDKYIVETLNFPFPMFLRTWQLICVTVATRVLARFSNLLNGVSKIEITGDLYSRYILPIGFCLLLGLQASTQASSHLSGSAVDAIKSTIPFAVLGVDLLYRGDRPGFALLVKVFLIVSGAILAISGEIKLTAIGIALECLAVCAEATRLVLVKTLLQEAHLDALGSLYHIGPICALMSGLVSLTFEGPKFSLDAAYGSGIVIFALYGFVSLGFYVASILLIDTFSPLDLCYTGIFKDIVVAVGWSFYWSSSMTLLQLCGTVTAFIGLFFYVQPDGYDKLSASRRFMMVLGFGLGLLFLISLAILFPGRVLEGEQANDAIAIVNNSKVSSVKAAPPETKADAMQYIWNSLDDLENFDWDRRKRRNGKPTVCVLQADTREMWRVAEDNEFDPFSISYLSMTTYFNLWWALIHGYDYKRILLKPWKPGYGGGWPKFKAIVDTLQKYDMVVFMDGDVFVTDPAVSLEFLLERWGFPETGSIIAPKDPIAEDQDKPWHPNFNATNTGFMILRNTSVSRQALIDTMNCPEQIPGCDAWKSAWPCEQRVFAEYVKPNLDHGKDFFIAPCNEANGWWGAGHHGCYGTYITHAWNGKDATVERMGKTFLRHHLRLLDKFLHKYHYEECSSWEQSETEC